MLGVKTVIHYEGENHAETYIIDNKKGRYIDYQSIAVVNFDAVKHIISTCIYLCFYLLTFNYNIITIAIV